ncbi:DNA adenine methylase [Anaeromassilibacillus senegalensis]|uniref:DNA adenine methylase n=1 Tax=Anaeromassilibacillus senegalensis TaxID=1673717 RepID=UPI0006809849|nr:DNA adenine methylase [Anaeromassilibacillus senegalensis]
MDSFISRVGGKKLLRNKIIDRFPDSFGRYIEVFGGAGWVLFARDRHAPMEVYNDADGQLVNLFRVVKYHPNALQEELQLVLNSREVFQVYRQAAPTWAATDIQRAALYFVLIKESFGAECRTFGCTPRNLDRAVDYLTQVSKRLSRVVIERKDFADLIKVYDRPDALFYLDPPYHGTERYYDTDFTEADHHRLKEVLIGIKGKFILSYNNDDFIRNLYTDSRIEEVSRSNNLAPGQQFEELIIRNY